MAQRSSFLRVRVSLARMVCACPLVMFSLMAGGYHDGHQCDPLKGGDRGTGGHVPPVYENFSLKKVIIIY
jgi:hypothetical protein